MIKKFKTFESSKLTDTINEIEDIFKNLDLDYDLEVMVSEANVSQHHLHSEVSLKDGDLIRTKIKVIIVTIKFLRYPGPNFGKDLSELVKRVVSFGLKFDMAKIPFNLPGYTYEDIEKMFHINGSNRWDLDKINGTWIRFIV